MRTGINVTLAPEDRRRLEAIVRDRNSRQKRVKVVHVILDNYTTHKHPKVRQSLARHPRFVFHYTPTSASWLDAVETFLSRLT